MTPIRGFVIVIASGVAFALAGGVIGGCLGYFAPAYYYAVFHMPSVREYAVQIGVGLGATQGLIAGLVVGCVVVVATAWYRSRRGTEVERSAALRG